MSLTLSGGSMLGIQRQRWRAGGFLPTWFDAARPVAVPRILSPSATEEVQVADGIYRRDTGVSMVTDFSWPFTLPRGREATVVERSSDNEAVCIPDPSDVSRWLWVSNGTANLTLQCANRILTRPVVCATSGGGTVDTFLRFADGSLRSALHNAVDDRIAGKSVASALRIFLSQNHSVGSYTRNPDCWAADVDLTPISPWNSTGGATRAGILVSPRHVIFAAHYQPNVGATFRFVASDNTVVTRTMTAKTTLPGYTAYYPDITVGLLDSDVPLSIGFARVMPDDWETYLPGSVAGIPALCLDQEEKALVTDLYNITHSAAKYGAMVGFTRPTDLQRLAFYEDKIGGDSGNPACLILDGQLILLNVWTFGGAGQGTSIAYFKSAINTIMTSLGGGYQLTEADLSTFPTYS